jgi:hypothetical protein
MRWMCVHSFLRGEILFQVIGRLVEIRARDTGSIASSVEPFGAARQRTPGSWGAITANTTATAIVTLSRTSAERSLAKA